MVNDFVKRDATQSARRVGAASSRGTKHGHIMGRLTSSEFVMTIPEYGSMGDEASPHAALGMGRVQRALRTLSSCNRTLLRASDEKELLRTMCQVIVGVGGYRIASVAYAQHDEEKSIRWMASVGAELDVLKPVPFSWGDAKFGGSAVAAAIRSGQPCIARNVFTDPAYADPAYAPLREHARKHGYSAASAFPLVVDGEMLGGLTVAAPEPDAFDDSEMALLADLADDLAYGIANLRTRARHQESQQIITALAYLDPVTGLPNRLYLCERLETAMQAAREQHRTLALLHLDVGRFNEINKVLGFRAGEDLLLALVRRLAREVREPEMLARVGETEFVVLLPEGGGESAIKFAQRLANGLHEPIDVAGLMVDPSVAIGIALFPGHAADAAALLRRASAAVHQGNYRRGGYAMYTGGQEEESTRRLTLMADLHRAIKNGELQLYCQPKVDIASRRVCSAEALVRWRHPQHGMVPASEFIGLAEKAGTIAPVTNWMLEAVFRQCHAWQQAGLRQALAVNLSAHDLYDAGLVDRIGGLFSTWGIAPEMIQFELTESGLMHDPAAARETLVRLKSLGVQLFIDDYGTGYSSLSYLQKLPVDAIKIDQSFVKPMIASDDSSVIVSSTIELGHKLGLKVVAEGVETEDIWNRLAELGCDVAQGYWISRPMPAQDFIAWERRWRADGCNVFA
jgi:diguanylate cyclase (GGDEF)-like protein